MSMQTGGARATNTPATTDTVRGGYETPRPATPRLRSTETRKSFRTTEFIAFVVITALTLLSAYTQDGFDIDQAWTLVAVITSFYMLSRGIAKAGSREPRYDDGDR
ncbi:MAG: hypothetical protein QOG87_2025 [Actinomycetota bacterium]|jgi:hypothetical protein